MSNKPLTVAIVGAGHRALIYANYALDHPDRLQVVAVAEPDEARRDRCAQLHSIPPERCFPSYQDLTAQPRLADAIINGTMDRMHYESALPLLARGYHMLLEKPIASSMEEIHSLVETARNHQATVMICHVLRYAPFYVAIKEKLESGAIGEIVSLHSTECVSYHHMVTGFIRGRWNNTETSNPMLLAKCCHDLDIVAWCFSGIRVKRVSSFGSLSQFKPEKAPPGSALRCLDGCRIEPACPYSARELYLNRNMWRFYTWGGVPNDAEPTPEQKEESLRTTNPYGRCIWHCDNDVVDHQSVIMEFENGATASHDMFCATPVQKRAIHIVGTLGEIQGSLEESRFIVRRSSLHNPEKLFEEEVVDIAFKSDQDRAGHGGGDARLMHDFVGLLSGDGTSRGVTRIEDSLTGHQIAYAADVAMREHRTVEFP